MASDSRHCSLPRRAITTSTTPGRTRIRHCVHKGRHAAHGFFPTCPKAVDGFIQVAAASIH